MRLRRATGKTFSSLRTRNFRLYFIGQAISISGTWMQSYAQGWLVVSLRGTNALDLGFTIALPFVPMLLFGAFGGVVVDRSDKRAILFITQSCAGLLALALGILVVAHHVSLPAIWTIAGLLGVVNLFDNPARQSFVQEMVGREQLSNAVSLNSAMINGGRILGPALGGLLSVFGWIAPCFFVNAASYVAVIVALGLMDTSQIRRIRTVSRGAGQVREGFAYVWRTPALREVLASVCLVGTFAFNFTVTLPVFERSVLHGTASDYAALMCAMGFGGLVGGLAVAYRSRPTRPLLITLCAMFAAVMGAVALAPSELTAALELVVLGAVSLAFISTANATLQLHSAEELRGRVMSLYAIGFLGTTPIGALCVSAVADATNARVALAVGAVATGLACAYLAVTAKARVPQAATATGTAPATAGSL